MVMGWTERIFDIRGDGDFNRAALDVFRFQAERCAPYREYISLVDVNPSTVDSVEKIPFLPVEFFKTHRIYCGDHNPEAVFTSSGTTGSVPSRHYVASLELYKTSYETCFRKFYGDPGSMAIFALLPGYLERSGSSLVTMVEGLVKEGTGGGFFLNEHEKMLRLMEHEASAGRKIMLIGVSFALWELAEKQKISFPGVTVIETGGMKGRRREITRAELHAILKESFGVKHIHSEYGMTELLSQAWSAGEGVFHCPGWMKILVRDMHDPLEYLPQGRTGGVNVIDLANVYSCSFISTGDLGTLLPGGGFSVEGRMAGSDIRGCNLMVSGL